MIVLARYIMAGPAQATLVTVVMALLALLLPPLAWISAAAVALVTLQLGAQRGLQLVGLASVAGLLLGWLIFGAPLMVLGLILLIWLPVWIAALVLRQSVSLTLAMQAITGLGVLTLLMVMLIYPQLQTEMNADLQKMMQPMLEQQTDDAVRQELQETVTQVLRLMPALVASGMMLSTAIGLLLARNWQARLYNPGGFAREFNQLRLGKVMAAASTALIVAALALDTDLLVMLSVILISIYVVQGMALIHGLVAVREASRGWVFAVYIGLILLPQVIILPIAFFGMSDAWIDFRRRLNSN
jgi:hypothetical protein